MMPSFENLREGRNDCPSDLALDRLHAEELDASASAPLQKHIAGCEDCTHRMQERRAGFDGLEVDPRKLLAKIRTGVDKAPESLLDRAIAWVRGALVPVAGLVAVAGGVLFVVSSNHGKTDGGENTVTSKGNDVKLTVYRNAGGRSERAMSGDRFSPGDQLKFVVDLPRAGFVSVIGAEESGQIYTAWPLDASVSMKQQAGEKIELEGAVSLDKSTGRETLYLVECLDKPQCISGGAGQKPLCQPGCEMTPFVMEKKP